MGKELPTGVVTFLFSDIEGSTSLARDRADRWPDALDAHNAIVRQAVTQHGGVEVKSTGDGFFLAFAAPDQATTAACEIQRRLRSMPDDVKVSCRMGLHTGAVAVADGDYVGLAVHEAARVADVASGGQILATDSVRHLAGDAELRNLGRFLVRDFGEMNLFEVVWDQDRPAGTPRAPRADTVRLPQHVNTFVGRARELASVARLAREHRLVTLVGPGGAGKTRLAIEAARRIAHAHEHDRDLQHAPEVWFVDLSTATDDRSVASTAAAALEHRSEGGPLEHVLESLGQRRSLVVLDNCEHVVDGAAALAASVLATTNASIVATSREALAVSGEVLFEVPALDAATDAVELFVDRARALGKDVASTAADRTAIAELSQHLDGLPLAIELAASRLRTLSLGQLAERLDDRFRVLQSRDRDRAPRQRTLWDTIDWSYQLLDDGERAVIRRLAVFAGGFTVEVAERVVTGGGVEQADVFDLLDSLVAKSLVSVGRAGGVDGFRLLETIREYASDRLREAGEEDDTRLRQLAWALDLCRSAQVQLRGPDELQAYRTLDAEYANVVAAIGWGLSHGQDIALEVVGALYGYLGTRVAHAVIQPLIEGGLSDGIGSPSTRARAHAVVSFLCGGQDDDDGMERHAGAALAEIGREPENADDAWTVSWAMTDLAWVLQARGELDAAETHLRAAVDVAERWGDDVGKTRPLQALAEVLARRGDVEGATALLEAAVDVLRRRGMCNGRCYLLTSLSGLHVRRGRIADATAALEEGLVAAEQLGERRVIVTSAMGLTALLAATGAEGARVQAIADRAVEVATTDGLRDLLVLRARQNSDTAVATARRGRATGSRAALDVYGRIAEAIGDAELAGHVGAARRAVDDIDPPSTGS